ncbi:MAG: response regulator transcription factor [Acetatifactor sp.]|nr:response regulator transcription factor [Acetatifactor sp.]
MERNIGIYNDHTGVSEKMRALFAGENIRLQLFENWEQLLLMLEENRIHLMLVDVELDDRGWYNGVEVLAQIRQKSSIPIIVVSAQGAEAAKIMALNAGADDYVVDGYNPLELLARVKCQLRRYDQLVKVRNNIDQIYKVDDLEVNDIYRRVTVEGREVKLTPIEYNILKLLIQERGKVLSISQIYESIWHMQAIGADNTIAVHIRHIREKIEQNPKEPRYLKVVWGTGYKVG